MVTGLNIFRDYFADDTDKYVLIGGAACDIVFTSNDATFRATKDLDMVLIVEALSPEFGEKFWKFIDEGGYENCNTTSGKPQFFRFTEPKDPSYPKMIELFARTEFPLVGKNVQNQSFSKRISDLFPGYDDEANFELFSGVNSQVALLEKEGLITVKRKRRGKIDTEIISSVALVVDRLDQCYSTLGRQPKTDRNAAIKMLLNEYCDRTPLLHDFCKEQLIRLDENKKVKYSDDLEKLEQILKVLAEIESIEEETFIRNFSIRVLGDSKAFEHIKTAVVSLLCEHGDYPDKECVLQDLNIVNNPGYVYVKGNGTVTISGQTIDFGRLDGDFGLSSAVLDDIEKVEISASKVITIENLTTFNSFMDKDAFVIYLGGYHNSIRRNMIRKIYENNPDKKYFHYGDIDAGGFYILLDLRSKTGISFAPFNMDLGTIKKYKDYTKKLTDNDRTRLKNLLGGEFDEVINYMLENDCKLEQEAIEQ